MNKINKPAASFFFAILAFAPILLIVIFSLKQHYIRYRMKEDLETSLLQSITLENEKIQWIIPGKEIWIHGKMFDIKSKIESEGKTTFKGLYDEEETELKISLEKSWEKNNTCQVHLLGQIFQNMFNIYFINLVWEDLNINEESTNYPFYISQLYNHLSDIQTPPPRV